MEIWIRSIHHKYLVIGTMILCLHICLLRDLLLIYLKTRNDFLMAIFYIVQCFNLFLWIRCSYFHLFHSSIFSSYVFIILSSIIIILLYYHYCIFKLYIYTIICLKIYWFLITIKYINLFHCFRQCDLSIITNTNWYPKHLVIALKFPRNLFPN